MSTFDEDESSRQSNRPIEFADIALSTGVIYRIACGERDLQVGSTLYVATPSARTSIDDSQAQQRKDVTVTLPVAHPVVKRWFALGVPPRQVTVTWYRKQERSGMIEQQWSGLVTSVSCDAKLAQLTIPARTTDTLKRMLPTITSGPACVHVLYDAMCKVARASFLVSTTAILVNGRDITVDMGSLTRNGDWSKDGEIVHVATGERMTIALQADADPGVSSVAVLTMQDPIPELKTGDAIQVYAGCDHANSTCNVKFTNQANFVGDPYKPTQNPAIQNGYGTISEA